MDFVQACNERKPIRRAGWSTHLDWSRTGFLVWAHMPKPYVVNDYDVTSLDWEVVESRRKPSEAELAEYIKELDELIGNS